MKKILYIFFILILIYSSINIFFYSLGSTQYEISVNSKNREYVIKLIEGEYKIPDKTTKIKMKIMLGDANLYLYTNFHLNKKILVSSEDKLANYILENGTNASFKYLVCILISLIFVLLLHE